MSSEGIPASPASPADSRRRLLYLGAALALALGVLGFQFSQGSRFLNLPLFDFVAFWSASQLNADGVDPYDPALLEPVQRAADPGLTDVLVMWPAPWTLGLLKPFCTLPAPWARLAWVVFLFGLLVFNVDVAWRHFGGDPDKRWVAWLIAFLFLPSYFVLVAGQLGPILLAGFVGFLVFVRRGQYALAGACLAVSCLKPQISYLFWFALLFWVIRHRRWSLLLGGTAGVALALAWPLVENPTLLADYYRAITERTRQHGHTSPLLGSAVRLLIDPSRFGLQFVFVPVGFVWLAWYWRRHRESWDWDRHFPVVLVASLLTAPYGAWPFDLVVLLPLVLAVAVKLSHAERTHQVCGWGIFATINLTAGVLIFSEVEYFWFLWMTPALGLACWALPRGLERPSSGPETALA